MTETEKAQKLAETLFEAAWHKSQPRQIIRKMAEVLESELATYGAAQYEAGAASTKELLREVWAEFQALAAVDAPELSWPDMQKRVETVLRALPLREKEG